MNEETLFAEASAIESPDERSRFLDKACAGNVELRQAVERLLRLTDDTGSFRQPPPIKTAVTEGSASSGDLDATILHRAGSTEEGAATSPLETVKHDEQERDDEIPLGYLQPSLKPESLGRLGHYEVLEVVGRGAFGTVLRAFDEKLQRVVAIKVLAPEMAATSPARKRFLREARTSAAIRHENVVAIHAVEDEPIPYLVMEYIPGQTLQQRLDKTGPLAVLDVLKLGKQIADGLAAAHDHDLIHRDIKPGNILLEGGVNERVKITDFGLARTADDASVTQSGLIAGTPMYMAPEQALGQKLDQRADLFSFGSVLYQMLSGRPPFRAANTVAVLKRVVEDTPRPIQEIIPEVPTWMCELVSQLHAKNPDERIQTAKEVSDLLGQCLDDLKAGRVPKLLSPSQSTATIEFRPATSGDSTESSQVPKRPLGRIVAVVMLLLVGLGITEATGVTKVAATVIRLATGSRAQMVNSNDPSAEIVSTHGSSDSLVPDYALSFNGKNASVQTPVRFDVTKPLTVEAMITVPGQPSSNQVVLADAELGGFGLGPRENGKWRMDLQAQASLQRDDVGYVRLESDNPITYGTPTHVATIFDGRILRLYVNGRLQARRVQVKDLVPSHLPIMIGANPGLKRKSAEHFLGTIDEVRISNVARYTGDFTPAKRFESDEHTLALYHFDEGSGDVLKDSSGNGHDGKIVGATWVKADGSSMDSPNADGWVQLFNGKDLTGWKLHPEQPANWHVADGLLTCRGPNSHLFSERGDFGDFQLRFEWRTSKPEADSGIYFRCDYFINRGYPPGYEVNLGRREDGSLMVTPPTKLGGDRLVAPKPTPPVSNQWRTGVVTVVGETLTVSIDGEVVAEYSQLSTSRPVGHIALEHLPDGDPNSFVEFRKIEIKELSKGDTSAPPRAIAPFDAVQATAHQEAWAKHLGVPVEYTNSIGMKFRLIPPGEFTMGSTPEQIEAALQVSGGDSGWNEWINSEPPPHKVILTQPLYLGATEVTQSQYLQLMRNNPSDFSATGGSKHAVVNMETGKHPVENVSWNDAAEFCTRLSLKEKLKPFYLRSGDTMTPQDGSGYRLPTEAEWEFACRAGTTTWFWSGDDSGELISVGWFGHNAGNRTHAVGELSPNPFGLFDIHGNVWESVQDSWDPAASGKVNEAPVINPLRPFSAGSRQVFRGGNWDDHPINCRSSTRLAHPATFRHYGIGFRAALTVDAVKTSSK